MTEREQLIRELTERRDEARLLGRVGLSGAALIALVWLLIGGGGLLVLGIGFGVMMSDGCASAIMQVQTSPDGAYDAVLFERNCGAMDGYSTNVSVVPAGSPFPEKRGNVLQMRDHPEWNDVTLFWDGDRVLGITHNGARSVLYDQSRYGDVSIQIEVVR